MPTQKEATIIAYKKGYRTNGRAVIGPSGVAIKLSKLGANFYPTFSIRLSNPRRTVSVRPHKLAAFEKFGEKAFATGIHVRHLDGDKSNFSPENIELGTPSQNALDIPKEIRRSRSISASSRNRAFTDKQVAQIKIDRVNGLTYQQISDKWCMGNKGMAHQVVNRDYVTTF